MIKRIVSVLFMIFFITLGSSAQATLLGKTFPLGMSEGKATKQLESLKPLLVSPSIKTKEGSLLVANELIVDGQDIGSLYLVFLKGKLAFIQVLYNEEADYKTTEELITRQKNIQTDIKPTLINNVLMSSYSSPKEDLVYTLMSSRNADETLGVFIIQTSLKQDISAASALLNEATPQIKEAFSSKK